ncbi:MAG: hypothetical protein KC457_35600 [Myxococcales bacterium]|nr:hypothetical protein [Myxococcales bacterium]
MSKFFLNLPRVPLPGPWAVPLIGSRANVVRFFADPQATLRRLAPDFAAVEDKLEPVFWTTRIQPFPLDEHVVKEAQP